MINYLKTLSELEGPPGNERKISDYIKSLLDKKGIEYEEDFIGNLYVFKKGTNRINIRFGIFAHIDEVGFLATGYTKKGSIKFRPLGGINPEILPGTEVKFLNGIKGIITTVPPHKKKNNSKYDYDSLVIDIGVSSEEEAKERVPLGTEAVFITEFEEIRYDIYKGKAFDDRVGVAVLLSIILDELIPFDIIGVFTVQEEMGLVGAEIASSRKNIDLAIVLEGTFAFEPYHPEREFYPCIGKGPVITKMDRSIVVDRKIIDYIEKAAKKFNIPYQWKIPLTGGTDAGRIHLKGKGVKVGIISVPCRYIHSKASLIFRGDLENVKNLVLRTMEVMYDRNFEGIV